MAATTPMSSPLLRRGLYLEYLILGWNVVGASLIVSSCGNSRVSARIGSERRGG